MVVFVIRVIESVGLSMFAAMMSIHHQMAIDMADVMPESGSNPELKAMAAKMKAEQQEEIKQLAPYTK